MKPPRILFFLSCLLALGIAQQAFAQSPLNVTSDQTLTTGTYQYTNVTISNNATLFIDGTVKIEADNVTINSGSSIDATGNGYGPNLGPGAGSTVVSGGSGGAYGGNGGENNIVTGGGKYYGSATVPFDMGSGGGSAQNDANSGGSGGGGIWLEVSNTVTVNGTLAANGGDVINTTDDRAGGGSGGSVLIDTITLAGSGAIEANGGAGGSARGGGGGGGRIAVYYDTSTFSGSVTTEGGESVEDTGSYNCPNSQLMRL